MTDGEQMVKSMTRMAMMRQAEVSAKTYVVYAMQLQDSQMPADVVDDACRTLGLQERAEGETAFPSMGTLLRVCRQVQNARVEAERRALAAEGARRLAAWDRYVPELSREEARAFMQNFRAQVDERVRAGRGDKDAA